MSFPARQRRGSTRPGWDCVRWSGALPVLLAALAGVSLWKTSVEAFSDGPALRESRSIEDSPRLDLDDPASPESSRPEDAARDDCASPPPADDRDEDERDAPREAPSAAAPPPPASIDGRVAGCGRFAALATQLAAVPPDLDGRALSCARSLAATRTFAPSRRPGALRPSPRGPPACS